MKDIERETKPQVWGRLADFSQDLLCTVDGSGKFVHLNSACESILGYTKQELIGHPYAELLLPEDRLPTGRAVKRLMVGPSLTSFENRLVHRDGRTVHLMWSATWSAEDGLIYAIGRDITERKTAQLRLQESEQRYRGLFEQNPDILFLEGGDGRVIEVNGCFVSTLGIAPEDIVGRKASSFLPGEMGLVAERSLQAALRGETLRYDMEIVVAGKELRVFDTIKQPVKINGVVIGVQTIAKDITPMVRAYATIQQQAEKLGSIFESITDAFFTLDRDWRLTYVNGEFDRLLGTDRRAILGRSIWEVFPGEEGGLFYRQYQQVVESGEAVHFEAYYGPRDMWLQVKAFPCQEGLTVYFDDITERVRAHAELEKLSEVAKRTTNSVIITDAQGLTEWVNEGFTRITGYTLAEMRGKKPGEVLQGPETDPATVERVSRALKAQVPFTDEILNYRKSGEKFWFQKEVTPIFGEAGELTRFIAIQSDVTERKQQEAQRQAMARELYRQNKDLQQFTYIVSHNLRAPVANALGLSELLLRQDRHSEQYGLSLGYLRHSIQRLDEVLRDVNQVLSVRDRGNLLALKSIAVTEVWAQALRDLAEPLQSCGARVEARLGEGLLVQANQAYLHSVFYNLLSNAVKYRSPARPLLIRVEGECRREGEVALRFSDNGSGLDLAKAKGKLFGLYQRFHRGTEGKGVGLFLVKAHVEAMGGRIEVSSEVEAGTTFTIHLKKG